jgi:succinate dehydrogenase / fumarate reductase membrane anchor subunit
MSLRTPLGRVRGLGSAKDGTHHWWMQRVTAVALIPLVLLFAGYVLALVGSPHAEVAATLGSPLGSLIALLLIAALFYHFKLGIQVVIEDYVHGEGAKIALIMLSNFFCIVVGLASALSVLKLAFGG